MRRAVLTGLLIAIVAWLALTVTNTRILIRQHLVRPGESYLVESWGDVGARGQASLVCRYFNGRQLVTPVFWHAPNNFMGRDSCPVLTRPS